MAGFRLAVPWDILLVHDSPGIHDSTWQYYGERFVKKHVKYTNFELDGSRPTGHLAIRFTTQSEMIDFHRNVVRAYC